MIEAETVIQSRVDRLAERVKADVFVNAHPDEVDGIEGDFYGGTLSENDAIVELRELQRNRLEHLVSFDRESVPHEWNEISNAIGVSKQRYPRKAEQQFFLGTFSLLVALLLVFIAHLVGWQGTAGAAITAGLLGAGLASLAVHACFVLRVHQQASTAAERLAEKLIALLFLKLALSSEGEERKSLLEAGTSMFLGHQAPETLPLSPQDLKLTKEKET